MRALTWNLYHGRASDPAGRSLLAEFCAALAGWEWDVALLQEVPPWWPPALARACGASSRSVLTSRNAGQAVRRAVASRAPDLLGANGGGANAILARVPVLDHRAHRLTRWPERRWAQAVRLRDGWVVNLHASTHREAWALRDTLRAYRWAPRPLLVFGGDLNLRAVSLPGLRHVAGHHVDHLFSDGRPGVPEVLDRGRLSDHPPVRVTL
jgi:endonuclease/exonuclease/phosphatase family metal-dependent hydrolase